MPVFVHRLQIRQYKSIARCSVSLGSFSLLVGPNGSGKSNFLDALRFVADALRTTLDHAVRDRGGIQEVRRRSRGHPRNFGMGLDVIIPDGLGGSYAFLVGATANGGFAVLRESCRLGPHHYAVQEGRLESASIDMRREIEPDRLYLTYASTFPEFRPLYDALSRMGFYNLNPESLRALQDPDPGDVLLRDGRNAAAAVRQLKESNLPAFDRMVEYIRAIVPGVESVEPKPLGPKETLEFRQQVAGDEHPWRFLASNMSDGTLRVLGILVALYQGQSNGKARVPLVGIEEPEIALHPAAAGKLMDALLETARRGQVVVTTHSPDLLDHTAVTADHVLAVDMRKGETLVSKIDEAGRTAVRDRLYTVGELLRLGQIEPDARAFEEATSQMDLFPDVPQS
jgi:predicted ATPase